MSKSVKRSLTSQREIVEKQNNLLIGAEVTEKLKQEELLLTKPVREHSCTMHSTGDRWGTEKCLACAYEAGAKAQLAKVGEQ